MSTVPRVAIFRHKNYTTEYETRRNRREFRQNSVCLAEEKNHGIPFRTIFGREKLFHSKPFLMIKPWNSFPNHFQKRKLRNSFPDHFQKKKNSEFHSDPFSEEKTLENPFQTIFGTENTRKTMTFVSCFVKLHYFRGIPFRSVRFRTTKLTLSMNTEFRRMSTFFHGITETVPCLFRGFFSERNFDGNPNCTSICEVYKY